MLLVKEKRIYLSNGLAHIQNIQSYANKMNSTQLIHSDMKYTIIKNEETYYEYCKIIEELANSNPTDEAILDDIDLLTLLIEKWDEENTHFITSDPVQVLRSLMDDHHLKAKDLADILGTGKSLMSEILHYRKGFSKEIIRKLSDHFKLRQEIFNRPYKLVSPLNSKLRNASVMNIPEE